MQAGGHRFDPGPLHSTEVLPTTQDAILRSRNLLAFRQYDEPPVHLSTDSPEGKLTGIARRDAVTDQVALERLELCAWCQAIDRQDRNLDVMLEQLSNQE